VYRSATKRSERLKAHRHQQQISGTKSRLQLETVNKYVIMLTTAIPANGLYLYRTSAITATAELLVFIVQNKRHCFHLVVVARHWQA